MIEVRWAEQAAADLAAIKEFIGHDSPALAQAVVSRLYRAVGQLETFPDSGREIPERRDSEFRELIRPPYRIAYHRGATTVEILTVFHSSRLLPDILRPAAG